jgi:hypothetical protein
MLVETVGVNEGEDPVQGALTFTGEGEGMIGGDISDPGPKVAGRWSGSGLRRGTLVFELLAGKAGIFRLPIRLVLSAP